MTRGTHSLRWRLVRRLIALQAALLGLVLALVVGLLWASGSLMALESEDAVFDALREAVVRDAGGGLAVRATSALAAVRASAPDLWFVVRDAQGHAVSEGDVPPEYARIGGALDAIGQARLGWNLGDPARPTAHVRRIDTPAGTVHAMTGPGGAIPLRRVVVALLTVLATLVLPAGLVMALATLVATPLVVRRGLAGLDRAAADAARVDVARRGTRLSTTDVPVEAMPLVDAVNDALDRLDEGHARERRFLADAAHELRTPIAILQTRIEAGAAKPRLLEDVARLANLAGQLLDLQRLDERVEAFSAIDLAELARGVAAEMAPLAIAAGYGIAVEVDGPVRVDGDRAALERALTNLVQNAIRHGGGRGTIGLHVHAGGTLDVTDEGDGVPAEQRERIFEPFHRAHPDARGAGLGLHLVRETLRHHGGRVDVVDAASGGACFRMSFPRPEPG